MSNKQEVVLHTISFPIASCPAIMLLLNNKLLTSRQIKESYYIFLAH